VFERGSSDDWWFAEKDDTGLLVVVGVGALSGRFGCTVSKGARRFGVTSYEKLFAAFDTRMYEEWNGKVILRLGLCVSDGFCSDVANAMDLGLFHKSLNPIRSIDLRKRCGNMKHGCSPTWIHRAVGSHDVSTASGHFSFRDMGCCMDSVTIDNAAQADANWLEMML
jgi:hypothetical protein